MSLPSLRSFLIAATSLAFAASVALAQAPPAGEVEPYRVGPGDGLEITIHSGAVAEDALKLNFPVAGDGSIDVVHAGRLTVSGLSTSEVQDRIRRKLIASGFMAKPYVSVNVTDYQSQCVNVSGAVTKQGRFCLRGPTRLQDILSQAEGVVEEMAGGVIRVNRAGAAEPILVDRRALVGPDLSVAQAANIRVLAGDNIHVPAKARFCINGPLESAGCYAFGEGATLHQALALAGGLKEELADRKNVVIRRRGGVELHVDLDAIGAGSVAAPVLEPDDQITVGTIEKLRFCVNGEVEKADCYEYVKGQTIEGAISMASGLRPNKADRSRIIVRRLVDERQQEFTVDLDDKSDRGVRFVIQAGDQITVPALDCLVTVGGGVRTPSQIEMKTGMTITDAIQTAGGSVDPQGFSLGNLSKVTLKREGSLRVIDVKAIIRGKDEDVLVACGDRIYVPTRALRGP